MGTIRLGCSGWDYRDWSDVFYKSSDESKLKVYSSIFNTAEINSTFYSYPAAGIVFGSHETAAGNRKACLHPDPASARIEIQKRKS